MVIQPDQSSLSDASVQAELTLSEQIKSSLLPSLRCLLASAMDGDQVETLTNPYLTHLGAIYACQILFNHRYLIYSRFKRRRQASSRGMVLETRSFLWMWSCNELKIIILNTVCGIKYFWICGEYSILHSSITVLGSSTILDHVSADQQNISSLSFTFLFHTVLGSVLSFNAMLITEKSQMD